MAITIRGIVHVPAQYEKLFRLVKKKKVSKKEREKQKKYV